MDAPLSTHWRKATCEEIGCKGYIMGAVTVLDLANDRMRDAAEWLRSGATGLRFSEVRTAETLVEFRFPEGQRCLESFLSVREQDRPHRIRLDRPGIYTQQTAVGVIREFDRPEEFTECMNEEGEKVRRLLA